MGVKKSQKVCCLMFCEKTVFMSKKDKVCAIDVTRQEYDNGISDFYHSMFITSQWINSVDITPEIEIRYIHFVENDRVIGKICGLVRKGTWFVNKFLFFYAAPGLIELDEGIYKKCLAALLNYARKNRLSKIDIYLYDQQYTFKCDLKQYYPRKYLDFVRFFDYNEEAPVFKKSFMYNVRKAIKSGATFHAENSERILNRLHELLAETKKLRDGRYGGNYQAYPYLFTSKESFNRLFQTGILSLYHVEIDGEVHCIRCALEKDKRMYGLMIASDAYAYKNSLQHFLQYNLINQMYSKGYSYYNVAGSDYSEDGKTVSSYKESLGCNSRRIYGAYTHFITFPRNMINPFMTLGMKMLKVPYLSRVVELGSRIISGRYGLWD